MAIKTNYCSNDIICSTIHIMLLYAINYTFLKYPLIAVIVVIRHTATIIQAIVITHPFEAVSATIKNTIP